MEAVPDAVAALPPDLHVNGWHLCLRQPIRTGPLPILDSANLDRPRWRSFISIPSGRYKLRPSPPRYKSSGCQIPLAPPQHRFGSPPKPAYLDPPKKRPRFGRLHFSARSMVIGGPGHRMLVCRLLAAKCQLFSAAIPFCAR